MSQGSEGSVAMRRGSLTRRVLEAIVALDSPDSPELKVEDVRAATMPLVQSKNQLARLLNVLIRRRYLCRVLRVSNRARREFGRPEILKP